jgi:hypothetical protein
MPQIEAARRTRPALIAALKAAGASVEGEGEKVKIWCPSCIDIAGSVVVYTARDGIVRFKCRKCGVGGDIGELREQVARECWGPFWTAESGAASAARPVAKVDPASELGAQIEAQIDGRFVNIPWPWAWLTGLVQGLTPGSRLGIVGAGGASKSFMVTQALAVWLERGIKVAVLELERSRAFHLSRVLAQRTSVADLTRSDWVRENPETVRHLFAEHREFLNRIGEAIYTVPRQLTTSQGAEWIEQRAAEGFRIVIADPVTSLVCRGDPWIEHEQFLARTEQAVRASGASLIVITHPRKGGGGLPDLDNIAGGAAWARSLDSVIWLESHDAKVSRIKTPCGSDEQSHNRTLYLLKTRSGEGENMRLAYRFETGKEPGAKGALVLTELGPILKTRKKRDD